MPSLPDLLASGHAWLYIPAAILLGGLHGLEPGHSKTMMAAFVIAVRGTIAQAVMLGVSAAISHSLVVWIVALGGQYLGRNLDTETGEPYLQILSAVIVLAVGLWIIWRTRRETVAEASHDHGHDHGHGHGDAGIAPGGGYMDAHERAHASDIERRFAGRNVSTGQIVAFGLTGGLIPCPAAITVLLLCLQLKQIALGVMLVLSFSAGLAITMVLVGVAASLSVRHVRKRWPGFETFARRVPYASGTLMLVIALYMGMSGWIGLTGGHLPRV